MKIPKIPVINEIIDHYLDKPDEKLLESEFDLVETGLKTLDMVTLDQEGNVKKGNKNPKVVLSQTEDVFVEGAVHCECYLIDILNIDPAPKNWPIKYIGVSKLSCGACHAWIRAFNETHTGTFQTRGTHGRWYPRWAMPPFSVGTPKAQEMRDRMKKFVGDAYRSHTRDGVMVRDIVLSDSSEADRGYQAVFWDYEEMFQSQKLATDLANGRIIKLNGPVAV